MTGAERHRRMDAARVRAELTVQHLWLHYVSLGGTGDAFDLDGYLQGLVPLHPAQQDVLAQALNEALDDDYRAYHVPLSSAPPDLAGDDRLRGLIDHLLAAGRPPGEVEPHDPGSPPGDPPPGDPPPPAPGEA